MHPAILRATHRSLLATRPRYLATKSATSTAEGELNVEPEVLTEYPDVPPINHQYLRPTGWQDNQMRRNYGDPLHEQEELYSMWSPDIPAIDPNVALKRFTMALLGFTGVFLYIKTYGTPEPHFVRRTYPYGGLVKELGGLEENRARMADETSEQ
ncbi:hypothetical protein E1B28_011163 [Marasmius oreades]|uniref:Uncharacterized protein n=1 Tax=Marasmius oreades TaxID=181124 RepID=A0A9P7RU55_9AGAR|nr:uncharacterized protein E1B28_011163 [Marasmius oreades]KAG7089483.1 hypothetical protein E1B28_011163 [Marasmius oreades]